MLKNIRNSQEPYSSNGSCLALKCGTPASYNQKYAQKVVASAIKYRNNVLSSTAWSAGFKFAAGAGVTNIATGMWTKAGLLPNAPTYAFW